MSQCHQHKLQLTQVNVSVRLPLDVNFEPLTVTVRRRDVTRIALPAAARMSAAGVGNTGA